MSTVPEPPAGQRTVRRAIDWPKAADLLAAGVPASEVARQVGCSPRTLARKRKHDTAFKSRIAGERAEPAPDDGRDLAELRHTLHDAIEKEVHAGNVRVILWLADRLKLVTPPDERTPDHALREILAGLSPAELREFENLRDAAPTSDD